MRIVDAHHHLWDLRRGYYPLLHGAARPRPGDVRHSDANYLPEHYRADIGGHDVVATVHVEAAHDPDEPVSETRWLAGLHRTADMPTAVVAYVDLRSSGLERTLDAHLNHPLVRGVRQMLDVDPRGGELHEALDDDRWRAGLRTVADLGLVFLAQVDTTQLGRLAEVVSEVPALKVVLCHAGLRGPDALSDRGRWVAGLERLAAASPNLTVAVSGLASLVPAWHRRLAADVTRTVLDVVGPRRAMFASNFPVDRTRVTFDQLVAAALEATAGLPAPERAEFFAGTATRTYRLPASGPGPGVV